MRTRLNIRFIVPLAILALLAVTNYGLLARMTDQLEADAAVANLAARQRMLTVQIAYSVDQVALSSSDGAPLAAARDALRTLTAELERAHQSLSSAQAHDTDAARLAADQLDARMLEFLGHARALAPDGAAAPEITNPHRRWIRENWEPILGLLEAAVANYQRATGTSVERLRTAQRTTLGASLLAMLAIAIGVFRPMARVLERILRGQDTIGRALAQERNFVDTVLDTAGALVMVVDRAGNVVRFNRAAEALTGRSEEEMVGLPVWQVLPPEDREPAQTVFKSILAGRYPVSFENRWLDRDGKPRLIAWSNTALTDAGAVEFVVATGLDITDRAELEARLRRLANYDTLTGLPNRALFRDRLAQAIAQAKRQQWNFCLMLLDLDRFKQINDTLGHQTGDELLQEAARRLRGCVRASDTVARLGGDEFTVLLQDVRRRGDVANIAAKIVAAMNAPFTLAGEPRRISTSVGIAFYPEAGEDAGGLLKNADIAMYAAKHGGGSRYCFFDMADGVSCTDVGEAANGVESPRDVTAQ